MSVSSPATQLPQRAHKAIKDAFERRESMADKSTDEANALFAQVQAWEKGLKAQDAVLSEMGRRYRACTFDSFEVTCESQRRVIDSLRQYAADAESNLATGRNVILIGPAGSGKDHLLSALVREVFMECGVVTRWVNGVDLLDRFHERALNPMIDCFGDPNETAEVLYLSDPLPPSGALSESKQSAFFGLIDRRYRAMKPTWISMNVANGDEAERRLGVQSVDRLRDGALILSCGWPSYRKAAAS